MRRSQHQQLIDARNRVYELESQLDAKQKDAEYWEAQFRKEWKDSGEVIKQRDSLQYRLDAVRALVGSEDWPALEQMGNHQTAVSTKSLLDLCDLLTADEEGQET